MGHCGVRCSLRVYSLCIYDLWWRVRKKGWVKEELRVRLLE